MGFQIDAEPQRLSVVFSESHRILIIGINLVILLVKTEAKNETVIHVDADNVNVHAAEYFDDYRHLSGNI